MAALRAGAAEMCLDLVVVADRELSPEQDKAVERLQLIGVVLTVAILIAIRVLVRTSSIDFWKLLAAGFASMFAVVALIGFLVSRVEQIPFRTLIRRINREVVADLKGSPERLRKRVRDAVDRVRSR